MSETFMGYWHRWGEAIALIAARAVGEFGLFMMDQLKKIEGSEINIIFLENVYFLNQRLTIVIYIKIKTSILWI
ncbi:MAG TPA: hypothetical protein VLE21_01610 [Candidatus Nitrosocosmicus sp.]|nr:hypothetical protein [Candidatus Nitrosocosmicus sp.]